MTPDDKLAYVNAYLDGMISTAGPQLSASLTSLKQELDKPSPYGTKKKVIESLAGNLPDISKGIISAKAAFEKGDAITGAAEIMNICAAVAPIIAAFSSAGGPVGMLVGSLFSVIGQIISLFQPPTESDVDKLKAFLLTIEADGMKRHAEANLTSIRHAAEAMREQARTTRQALHHFNTSLAAQLVPQDTSSFNHNSYLNFTGQLMAETAAIKKFKLVDGPTVLQHWGVASWLQTPDRQDQDEWPEILATFCQAWADLLTAYVSVISFANGLEMQLAFSHVAPSNEGKWTYTGATHERQEIENALLKLVVYANDRLRDIRNCNKTMSAILETLTPVARKRGTFVINGPWDLVAFTAATPGGQPKWGSSFWASCSRFLITAPKAGWTTLSVQHHLWVLDARGPQVGHQRIDAHKLKPVPGTNSYIGPAAGFSDLCALPSPRPGFENGHFVYFAHEDGNKGHIELFERAADGQLSRVSWAPASNAPCSSFVPSPHLGPPCPTTLIGTPCRRNSCRASTITSPSFMAPFALRVKST